MMNVVKPYLKKVAEEKLKLFNENLLKTVDEPNEKAANSANSAAYIILWLVPIWGRCNPNVRKYPEMIAKVAHKANNGFILSFRNIAAKMMAKTGCNFCSKTMTDRWLKLTRNNDFTIHIVPIEPPNSATKNIPPVSFHECVVSSLYFL